MTRVLVIDDEDDLRDDLRWSVEHLADEVVEAASLDEALSCLGQGTLDLVVADLKLSADLPDEGLRALEAAKRKDRDLPVIIVTAHGAPDKGVAALRSGAFDYIDRTLPQVEYLELLRHKAQLAIDFRREVIGDRKA